MGKKLIIGPSTGWIYAREIFDLYEHEKLASESGATAVEMCVGADPRRIGGLLSSRRFLGFDFRAAHLGCDSKEDLDVQIKTTRHFYSTQVFDNSVIHPSEETPTEYLEKLAGNEFPIPPIPISIENMDKAKKRGFDIEELNKLMKQFGFGFVLDVQHAWEHDVTMKYAGELLNMGKERLKYLHVSGETENNNHALVYQARNSKQIISFLGEIFSTKNVPIILEGEYKNSNELKTEVDFIKRELGSD